MERLSRPAASSVESTVPIGMPGGKTPLEYMEVTISSPTSTSTSGFSGR